MNHMNWVGESKSTTEFKTHLIWNKFLEQALLVSHLAYPSAHHSYEEWSLSVVNNQIRAWSAFFSTWNLSIHFTGHTEVLGRHYLSMSISSDT